MASKDLSQVTSWNRPTIRLSRIDFDQDGRKSSLDELLLLGGLFPLARIKDRLPFPANRVRAWGKGRNRELASCIVPLRAKESGRAQVILVHLDALSQRLEELAQASFTSDMNNKASAPSPLQKAI